MMVQTFDISNLDYLEDIIIFPIWKVFNFYNLLRCFCNLNLQFKII